MRAAILFTYFQYRICPLKSRLGTETGLDVPLILSSPFLSIYVSTVTFVAIHECILVERRERVSPRVDGGCEAVARIKIFEAAFSCIGERRHTAISIARFSAQLPLSPVEYILIRLGIFP